MKRKTNFDRYLEEQLKDPDFVKRYQNAGEAWDVFLQLIPYFEVFIKNKKFIDSKPKTAASPR